MRAPYEDAQRLLPELGRIKHLPHKPNTDRDDLVASIDEASIIFLKASVVEEKVDGTQVGVFAPPDAEPIVRNKNHVLRKGYGRKGTPAKDQYAPLFNWVYAHRENFASLAATGLRLGVHGEWIFAEHTIRLDLAPDDFIAYELYDVDARLTLPALAGREILTRAGFAIPPLLQLGVRTYEELEALTIRPSAWSSRDLREGVVVKVGEGQRLTHRFKMRRATFKPREDFNDTPLRRRAKR